MDQIMWNFSIYVHVKHILHSSDTTLATPCKAYISGKDIKSKYIYEYNEVKFSFPWWCRREFCIASHNELLDPLVPLVPRVNRKGCSLLQSGLIITKPLHGRTDSAVSHNTTQGHHQGSYLRQTGMWCGMSCVVWCGVICLVWYVVCRMYGVVCGVSYVWCGV